MALEFEDIGTDFKGLNGVYVGQTAPVFLGQADKSWIFNPFGSGRVAIGFDTRVSPTHVRLFFDRGGSIVTGTEPGKRFGLVLTREIRFDDVPIRPSLYSSAIKHEDSYLNYSVRTKSRAAWAIDMVSPRQLDRVQRYDPYYAFNAFTYTTGITETSLNAANGFLADVPYGQAANSPRCASLVAPIGLDLEPPFLSHVNAQLDDFKRTGVNPDKVFDISDAEIARGLLLTKTFAALQVNASEVYRVQFVGRYAVVTLADAEGYYPTLLIDPVSRRAANEAAIYQLDLNELDELRFFATSELFERVVESKDLQQFGLPYRPFRFLRAKKYGASRRTEVMQSGQDTHLLTCRYKAYAVGRGSIRHLDQTLEDVYTCFGGVEWFVYRVFDKKALRFGDLRIVDPTALRLQDVIDYNKELFALEMNRGRGKNMRELYEFVNTVQRQRNGTVDIKDKPDQWQWFMTHPPTDPSITDL